MPLLPPLGSHHVKNKRVLTAFCASTRDIKAKLHSVSFILLASTKVFILMQIAWFDIPGSCREFLWVMLLHKTKAYRRMNKQRTRSTTCIDDCVDDCLTEQAQARNTQANTEIVRSQFLMVVYFKSWRSRVHPQDGVWSWLVCFCASLEAAIVIGLAMSFGALLPA